jgi:hypothetical protein
VTVIDKSSEFYRPVAGPISGSVSKRKRAKISTVEKGYRTAINDPKLSLSLRLGALANLARFNPSVLFLTRLVRKTDNPTRLRLAATELLERVQSAATDLSRAELDAQKVLDGIRTRRQAAEPVESVFGGLDEK